MSPTHRVHVVAPAADTDPSAQATHVTGGTRYSFTAQDAQSVFLAIGRRPAAHVRHELLPDSVVTSRPVHDEQAVPPDVAPYRPFGHGVQETAPGAALYWPGAQAAHAVMLVELRYVPAGQATKPSPSRVGIFPSGALTQLLDVAAYMGSGQGCSREKSHSPACLLA